MLFKKILLTGLLVINKPAFSANRELQAKRNWFSFTISLLLEPYATSSKPVTKKIGELLPTDFSIKNRGELYIDVYPARINDEARFLTAIQIAQINEKLRTDPKNQTLIQVRRNYLIKLFAIIRETTNDCPIL